jgi:uncharacterized protein YdeI (YjbR/CyaY-like superfamily)
MGMMKNYLLEIEEALRAGQWNQALKMLSVFEEHAPAHLMEALEELAEWDTE